MFRWMAAALAAAALALAGCGGSSNNHNNSSSSSSSSGGGGGGGGGGSTLAIAADPGGALKFTQTKLTAKAGKVTIDFTNKSNIPHGVVITGNGVNAKTKVVTGGSSTATATLKPGTYTFYCPVPGHRQAGMQGTLTVS
jgi:plastocyanin